MKKFFTTTLDSGAKEFETIFFSAGKVGYQVEVRPDDLIALVRGRAADVIVEE